MKRSVLVITLIVIQISILFAQIPTDGLLFHYPLDGNINDASVNGEDGYAEYLTFGLDRFGNSDGAYFNQDGNLSGIVNQTLYTAPDECSVSFWFKTNNAGTKVNPETYGAIFSFGSTSSGTSQHRDREVAMSSDGSISVGLWVGYTVSIKSDLSYDDDKWHHLTFTLSSAGFFLYIDGNLIGSNPTTGDLNRSGYWRFGGWIVDAKNAYYGYLDDIRVYNRGLTEAEIQELYTEHQCSETIYETVYDTIVTHIFDTICSGPGFVEVPSEGLKFHYPVDGNLNDTSGNGEDGVVEAYTFGLDRFGRNNAAYINEGGENHGVVNPVQYNNPQIFSVAYWFKSDNGGPKINPEAYSVISSFTDNTTGTSFNHDRTVRLGSDGRLIAQIYPGHGVFLNTAKSYDDNQWHHVVISLSPSNGFELFVDGYLEDSAPSETSTQSRNGYWRFGGWLVNDRNAFTGSLDGIRVYDRQLTAEEVIALYNEPIQKITYDTVTTVVFDTTYVTIHDTIITEVMDTTFITINDTITTEIMDTTFITLNDTITTEVVDTIFVTETVVEKIAVTDTLIIDAVLTGINPPDNINTLKVYPNPAKEYIFINTGDYTKMVGYQLKIINELGAVVFETNVEDQLYEVNLSSWTGTGLYFVQVIDSGGEIIDVKKIVLQ